MLADSAPHDLLAVQIHHSSITEREMIWTWSQAIEYLSRSVVKGAY